MSRTKGSYNKKNEEKLKEYLKKETSKKAKPQTAFTKTPERREHL